MAITFSGVFDVFTWSVSGTDSRPGPLNVFPAKAYPEYPKIDPASIVHSQVRTAVADQNPGSATGLIKRLNRSQLTDTLAGLGAQTSQVECMHVCGSVQRTRNA
ncbi:hypothetical protein BN14_11996 [Rhizoctonia solani AG-1 IB]|uniref:Uncharacterized protein n=1 Tax=Thanatephorus cucumeris (strain AG1-IB / isolate 7/3/14) TaxID=1108050 RepID=M5CEG8_THACB|nr:hypothetical protein BN14_11996 [Rhizoctonia solani AG-1 IB]